VPSFAARASLKLKIAGRAAQTRTPTALFLIHEKTACKKESCLPKRPAAHDLNARRTTKKTSTIWYMGCSLEAMIPMRDPQSRDHLW
jgi:hypothetical protein